MNCALRNYALCIVHCALKNYALCIVYCALLSLAEEVAAREYTGQKTYDSYKGLVMADYQGWHNADGDGAGRGWYHYRGRDGFRPGSTNVDLWPEVSEYPKTYKSPFTFDDGTVACLQSAYDETTVDTHFRWMQEYGLDGVFMQRFVSEIRGESGRHHFDTVLSHAMAAANKRGRAIAIMYDLSGMLPGEEQTVLRDIQDLSREYSLKEHDKNPSYLYHNRRPLVAVWGVGFNDHRRYGLHEAQTIVTGLKRMGFSVMIGVPTHWRDLEDDTESDPRLLSIIRQCDIVMPWFVGRYNEDSYKNFQSLIRRDMAWCKTEGIDYAPLCYPGFSWKNMHYPRRPAVTTPRNKGSFFQKQIDFCIGAGAEMLYIAMFDEIDEGTAIYKIARNVPVSAPRQHLRPPGGGHPLRPLPAARGRSRRPAEGKESGGGRKPPILQVTDNPGSRPGSSPYFDWPGCL